MADKFDLDSALAEFSAPVQNEPTAFDVDAALADFATADEPVAPSPSPAAPSFNVDEALAQFSQPTAQPAPAQPSAGLTQLLDRTAPSKQTLLRTPPSPPPATSLPQAGESPSPTQGNYSAYTNTVRTTLQNMAQDDPNRPLWEKRWQSILNAKESERVAGVEGGKALATEQALAPVQNQLQQTAGGLTFGLSDIVLEKMRKNYGVDYAATATSEKLINSLGRMMGGVFSAQGLAQGVGSLTNKLGMEGMKQVLATRMGAAGIAASVNALSNMATDKRTAKQAAGDIAQNMVAGLVGFGAETAVPAGVKNWMAQVGADLVYDIITDVGLRDRLKDQSFKEWFIKEELPQLAMSVAFATKDLGDKGFETQRRITKKELKQTFDRHAKAQGVFDPRTTSDYAREIDVGRAVTETKRVAESLQKESYKDLYAEAKTQGLVKKGEPVSRTELADRITEKALEMARQNPSAVLAKGDTDAENFLKGMNQNRARQERIAEDNAQPFLERITRQLVDERGAVKKELNKAGAKKATRQLVLQEGASGEAGRQFGEVEQKIATALDGASEDTLSNYIHARRTVEATRIARERGTELKTSDLIGEKESQAFLDRFNANADPTERANIRAAADEYDNFMRSNLDQLLEGGMISPEAHAKLTAEHKSYSPRVFVDNVDPTTTGIKGERAHDSGIKALAEGSDKAMITDYKLLMAHVAARTQSRIFRNRANQALAEFARTDPENDIVRIRQGEAEPKRSEGIVKVFENGQEVELIMPKKLADEWNGLPDRLPQDIAKNIQFWSGTKLVKTLATGINPEFAFRNFFRDQQFAWFNSGQYSRFLPKAALQQIGDFVGLLKDAKQAGGIRNTEGYRDYVKQGGGLDYLSTQGAVGKRGVEGRLAETTTEKKGVKKFISDRQELSAGLEKAKTKGEQLGKILGWLGETSEIATRLAVRKRGIQNMTKKFEAENGRKPNAAEMEEIGAEATFIARNMLDFSQGGRTAKAMDSAIPYLNAAIQGTRGSVRAFKSDPLGTSFKAVQLIALGRGIAVAAQAMIPDIWNSISEEEKARKWIIPLPWKERGKNGELKGAYFAVPKDQFQQIFSAIGQSWTDGENGHPWGTQITESLASIMPVDASSSLPPVANAGMAYWRNYDTWRNEKVWRGDPNVSPSNEVSTTTPEMARQISAAAAKMGIEISPERLSTATSKLVPTSNPIASGLVDLYNMPFSESESKDMISTIQSVPVARSFLRFSRPIEPRENTLADARRLGIKTEGRIDQAILNDIQDARREKADLASPAKLGLDELLGQNPSAEDIRVYIQRNATSKSEAQSLKRRAKARLPEVFK